METRELPSTCTVDRLTDNNPSGGGEGGNGMGDLRWCVIESLFRADTIDFSVTGTINLAAVLPTLTGNVNIDGPGANLVTVRRNTGGTYRIFTVTAGVVVGISGLTITNGDDSSGGGGISNLGMLTISNCTVSANTAEYGSAGGILNSGMLTISNSTISRNTANFSGGLSNSGTLSVSNSTISDNIGSLQAGGIFSGGTLVVTSSTFSGNSSGYGAGLYNSGSSTIGNTTISGNTAGAAGGGIYNNSGSVSVTNSTIASNSAGIGGGIYVGSGIAPRNTIIAGNTATTGPDVFGNLGSQGHNLIGNPQDMTGWVSSDLLHVNPMLGPLQDNGGPTRTMGLLPGSPAIDAGDNANAPMWDQRGPGFRRIVNGTIDIGAFEVQAHAHGGPTRQPLPAAVPIQALPGRPLLGQPPDLPADPSALPDPGISAGQAGQLGVDSAPTSAVGGQQSAEAFFAAYTGESQDGDQLPGLWPFQLQTPI